MLDSADVIVYGGVLMWTAAFLELLLGNTFPFLVFMSFGKGSLFSSLYTHS